MLVYVAGYPKSGTTWLTRLLGDVLQCPTGASIERFDAQEIATEGLDRSSLFTVRKGHFVLCNEGYGEFVPAQHQMRYKMQMPSQKVIFMLRDPRDIAVSAMFHWNKNLTTIVQEITTGTGAFRSVGSWKNYVQSWTKHADDFNYEVIFYKNLLYAGEEQIERVLKAFEIVYDKRNLKAAYKRQSFDNRRKHVEKFGDQYNLGKEFNLRFMRKGTVGDWRNYFDSRTAFAMEVHCGDLLRKLGFEWELKWWTRI